MKKKNVFEKKYPLFVKYIDDETVQNNMISNRDLFNRCERLSDSIRILTIELDHHFDIPTIRNILAETVFKYPDEILLAFITSYLNSDEETKKNSDIVLYFNKTLHLGGECLDYIQKNGLIANRKYKDLPQFVVDATYQELKTGEEFFKEESLDDLYKTFSYPIRSYVNSMLEADSFSTLNAIFEKTNNNLSTILNILEKKGIAATVYSKENLELLGADALLHIMCILLESEEVLKTTEVYFMLLKPRRLPLLKKLIDNNLFSISYTLTSEDFEEKTNEEIFQALQKEKRNLLVKEG